MTAGSPRHDSNWRLWHPNQGILFQQPSYPNVDAARFSTEASAAETKHDAPGVSLPLRPATTHALQKQPLPKAVAGHSQQSANQLDAEAKQIEDTTFVATDIEKNSENNPSNTEPAEAESETGEVATIDVQPFTPLEYSIPEIVFKFAKAAPEGSDRSFWSYGLYQKTGREERVQVHYCKNAKTAEQALQHLRGEKLLGLDLEWLPTARPDRGPRKNVSLVQLASPSRVVLLHLALYPRGDVLATPTLKEICEDPAVRKVGVWIKGDCSRLKRYLGIESQGQFELSHLFNQVKYCAQGTPQLINKRLVGLATQVHETTGLPLRKVPSVRISNWSKPLSKHQIGYSASDAYAGVQVFAMLNHQRQKLDPIPDIPFHAELDLPIPYPPVLNSPSLEVQPEDGVSAYEGSLFTEVDDDVRSFTVNDTTTESGEIDASAPPAPERKKTSLATKTTTTPVRGPVDPTDPRILAAEAWILEYKSKQQEHGIKSLNAKLRAYSLWHANEDLNPEAIGKMLRIQPLTAVSYILDAVMQAKLPYDKVRMKAEVMSLLHPSTMHPRFMRVWKATENVVVSSSR